MQISVPVILIAFSFIANHTSMTSGKSIHNHTINRRGKTAQVNGGPQTEQIGEWLGRKIDIKEDFLSVNHTKQREPDHKRKLKVRKVARKNHSFPCSQRLSNASNPFSEVEEHLAYVHESSTAHARQSQSKKVLEKWQLPEFDVTAGLPDSSPRSDTPIRHGNWPKVTHLTLHDVRSEDGKLANLELCPQTLGSANLSTLIKSLEQAESVKKMFLKLKDMDDVEILRQAFRVDSYDKNVLLQNVDIALDFLKDFELTIHRELRKPEKAWNYSEEED